LEVIGAGFGRTGTMSLKVALEELGFGPCYHITEVFEHPEHVELWRAAAQEEPIDWDEIFHEYRATVDWPSAAFYKELMDRYPDAKVILTVRDPDRWYESTRTTIYGMSGAASSPPFSLSAVFVPRIRRIRGAVLMVSKLAWEDMFRGRFEDKEHAIEVFEGWNEEAKERVPAERLLDYEVKAGWGPLCEFLGVEAPGKPFPHLNDVEVFRGRIRLIHRLTITLAVFGVSLAGLVLMRFRRHRRV
jgi:hypothetical protein